MANAFFFLALAQPVHKDLSWITCTPNLETVRQNILWTDRWTAGDTLITIGHIGPFIEELMVICQSQKHTFHVLTNVLRKVNHLRQYWVYLHSPDSALQMFGNYR